MKGIKNKMKFLQSFIIAFSMYSKIPVPQVQWNKENMRYTMCFFPLVGAVIGLAVYFTGNIVFDFCLGSLFRSAVCTLLPIMISGGIHMDGFMDTMDALASYGNREKKLNILKDSHAGAFAVLGLGCYLTFSLGILSEVTREMLPIISCVFVISRSLSGFSVMIFPSAREDGLAKTFQDGAKKGLVQITMILYFMIVTGVMFLLDWKMAAGALLSAIVVFLHYAHMSRKQFGGVTGDLAGYFLQLSELAMITGIVFAGKL